MQATHSSSRILLPVRPGFILFSLLVMFLLNFMFPGSWLWMPDWVALALVFWSIREPHYVGMGAAFFSGLVMDVANASLLGQHALAYVLVVYMAFLFSKRIMRFPVEHQAFHAFPLLLLVQFIQFGVHLGFGVNFPGLAYFVGPFIGMALWLPMAFVLLLPQNQPIEHDENRPV